MNPQPDHKRAVCIENGRNGGILLDNDLLCLLPIQDALGRIQL